MTKPSDSSAISGWALHYAKASLSIGMSVPEIEQRLVAKGLSTGTAAAVVERVLEDRVRQQAEPLNQSEESNRWHRILSGLIVLADVVIAFGFCEPMSAGQLVVSLLLPLACIWFPEEMGSYTSALSWNFPSLGTIIRVGGWGVLLLINLFFLGNVLFAPFSAITSS